MCLQISLLNVGHSQNATWGYSEFWDLDPAPFEQHRERGHLQSVLVMSPGARLGERAHEFLRTK